ncbi:MAG: trehalose-phosphatase [Candidatus Omnitrophica bacterium]|nr:trehalose-phosphatase [Candidatus Omnitrophota bacterium]MDD5671119.1 trehalose-phosphatase [Candidatus Omnitrophota bacterium]
MKHLFAHWDEVETLIRDRLIVLFLDFDGTLSPIAARPELAKLLPAQRKTIKELSVQKDIKVVVISGRALDNLKKRVAVPGITYVGNHGLELEDPGMRHVHPAALESRLLLKKITYRLKKAFKFMPQILVENKMYSVSVHYRQLVEEKIRFAKVILLKEIGDHLGKGRIVLTEGKKVWEMRPPVEWNKGKTVLWILARILAHGGKRVLPIYLGDDVTDEDAFKVLQQRGLAIRVTDNPREKSWASHYLWSPQDVSEFLKRLKKIKTEKARNSPHDN